ncbi:MAG: methyltransferase domain-containing protein [SAR324 cluster bacterium]|nr:methyltransferase domain-containing protein [SAR324 cluster bacterium]
MRNIVLIDEFHETDFKPSEVFSMYLKLAEQDIRAFFPSTTLAVCPCPACGSTQSKPQFQKFGLQYMVCDECDTLYVSPRPEDAAILNYYQKSKAEDYWRNELAKNTATQRRNKILRPRLQWILDSTQEYCPGAQSIADVYTNQPGYIEGLSDLSEFKEKWLIHPMLSEEVCENYAGIQVIQTPFTKLDWNEKVDVISAFEVVDLSSDPSLFFSKLHEALKPGGLCFLTTILASGFDLQILWEHARNVFPPTRLNLFSDAGLLKCAQKFGFECIEFSTPGILDLEIIDKATKDSPQIPIPRFLSYLLKHRDVHVQQAFQEFLQSSRLSSYGRVLLRKSV